MITTYSRRRCYSLCRLFSAKFSSSSSTLAAGRHPNPPLHLDSSLKALLKDADMSLLNHKNSPSHRELQIYPGESAERADSNHVEPVEQDVRLGRKSPAAEFGSQKIGAVILPSELTKSINQLIQESNKTLLHVDARRLFLNEHGIDGEHGWDAQYDVRYRSRHQSARHAERDGIAFASVALPAHYSAIRAVLIHVRKRLEPSWSVNNVIDWGAGAGSGLWATAHSFQVSEFEQDTTEARDLCLSGSTILRYTGIDRRDGLVTMGKRLVEGIDCGGLRIRWRRSFQNEDSAFAGHKQMIALSAFLLSTLSSPVARRSLVKEMWESGAEVMVLIDHRSAGGFEAIAEAREYLLQLGKNELEGLQALDETTSTLKGSHVVAPCPHDGVCPLFYGGSSRITCGFSQRIQRPEFVRRTKHSKIGHEDIEYSYVVIRRGARPPTTTTQAGRIGEIGFRAMQQVALRDTPIKELSLHNDSGELLLANSGESESVVTAAIIEHQGELEVNMRQEAFGWPRLIMPPLKRSGHVILDCCTAEGKIMRMTIPRSQGKQPYYDARKSSWGDIFPHQPKNPGQERHLRPKQDTRSDTQIGKKSKFIPGHKKAARLPQERSRRHHLEGLLSEAQQ